MATHEVQAVRDKGMWQVFIDGFLVTEVSRYASVGFVARELLRQNHQGGDLTVRVVGRNQYIDA